MNHKKVFIIDTNVLLYHEDAIHGFPDSLVVVPMEVLEELDTFKTYDDSRGNSARYINRFLDNDCKQTNFNFEVKDFSNASTECKEYGLETDFDLSDLFLQHKPEDYSHLRNIL